MSKNTSIVITVILIIFIGIIFFGGLKPKSGGSAVSDATENSQMIDGVQYITINAKTGYSPKISRALAGVPTKLIVKTNGTYDCSASLVIRSLGFQKILAQTGEEVIDVGTPQAGQSLQGVCSMGMYNFLVNFI
ncbi:hypothetical protein COT95_02025 [Candidatus Falkowbacteria bacterium CG10_big_fil_rev_8_21_14_0_10_37_6]|uniref:EfeO-type cupredoxin-like domain-containing protein n=1 Tax=Candidatus Falkowbacteria bacterium CG10_big_fil_rev_8_21_14_0_10_37_6 TaxID=1974563 RepID=A0A2H0V6X2_9BACT|nr:MAG: hypothetical protein COT95_02025 [Candidatus Falkowbacteria bacterium CG10_big_fil_rev_8_21_14_0_10_37_6]